MGADEMSKNSLGNLLKGLCLSRTDTILVDIIRWHRGGGGGFSGVESGSLYGLIGTDRIRG